MQELEKILKEIKEVLEENKVIELNGDCTVDRCIIDVALAWDSIKAIIHNHINDGWIPVEERLPEEKKSVLVQWEKYDRRLNVTLTYLDVMWLEDEEDVVFETINGIPNGRVIAWRPLPEPYRPDHKAEKPDWRQNMLRKFDGRSRQ